MISRVFSIPPELPATSRGDGSGAAYLGDERNILVRVAIESVFEDHPAYNPLVLVGSSGTGKSMLLDGIAVRWRQENRGSRIVVTTGADFARDFARVTDAESLGDFRLKYRRAALLLIDDLQGLGDRLATQDELLHTVDQLVAHQRRIVVTLAHDPLETPNLSPGLASRLSAGLTVPLAPPGPAAQRALLRRFAADLQLQLSDGLIDLILRELPRTTGPSITPLQLRRTLLLVGQRARDEKRSLNEQLVQECLTCESAADGPELRSITQHVSRYFNVRASELKGPARQQRIVRARGVAMLLARRLTGSSLDEVGRHFGNRDHTTVLHACRKTESLMNEDPAIRKAIEELTVKLAEP